MPRYFVDLQNGANFYEDKEGSDLPDDGTARKEAIATLPEIARDELPDGEDHKFVATVRAEDGRLVYRATLVFRGERLI